MKYDQTPSYVSLAAVIVMLAQHFNFVVSQNEVITAVAGVAALVGIIKHFFAYRNAAKVGGFYPTK